MFKKVLVANRGEIALRVIRSCKELGIRTVAVFSEADRDSRAVQQADEAICIGPPPSSKSYLNIPNIISAARITGAEALHPGYGFLAENSYLAEICRDMKITFIGPGPELMDRLADKVQARDEMRKAGLPIIPGSERAARSLAERRHQKLVEESPSPVVSAELRQKMGTMAAKAAAKVGYTNAGTMEFLVDSRGQFYFMEINCRIQVEHPVTEAVYDVDLVKLQLAVAAGEKLTLKQSELRPRGHAIECRVNAEDPERDFAPEAGLVTEFVPPGGPGIRVDSHLFQGCRVPPFYDSLVAKVIAHGLDRAEAIARMRRALEEFAIGGIKTSIPFHLRVLNDPVFLNGQADTTYVDRAA